MSKLTDRALALLAALLALIVVALLGYREHSAPARCAAGFVALGARCCAEGQRLEAERCSGMPHSCPPGFKALAGMAQGCVLPAVRVAYDGGSVTVGPIDWEAPGRVAPRAIRIGPFQLDRTEVDHARWAACAAAGRCRRLADAEPGVPVSNVSASEAEAFCKFAGGRLPSSEEWLFAASGAEARRFPWGQTGLVCRRAVYGLVSGPCGSGGRGPDLTGSRPDGSTPEGARDLAGNVAEWTREPDGSPVARGGSFESRLASELKSWSLERSAGASPHIGLRCAYALGASTSAPDGTRTNR
jgi:formylglycine-generating enzyme